MVRIVISKGLGSRRLGAVAVWFLLITHFSPTFSAESVKAELGKKSAWAGRTGSADHHPLFRRTFLWHRSVRTS